MSKKQHVIIAPHPDDEIIGCFEIIDNPDNAIVIIYTGDINQKRREEALSIKTFKLNVVAQLFQQNIPPTMLNSDFTFYFPDPSSEMHPIHRATGINGEGLARAGENVIFYTTMMNVPYIHEVELSPLKEALLNSVYPSQKSLWQFEKKYVLFEGRCKWIF